MCLPRVVSWVPWTNHFAGVLGFARGVSPWMSWPHDFAICVFHFLPLTPRFPNVFFSLDALAVWFWIMCFCVSLLRICLHCCISLFSTCFALLDVLICVFFWFLHICFPHCVLHWFHDLQTVKQKNITFLCCRFDFLRRLNSKTGKLVEISRYALNCWKTHNNVQSNRKNCCSTCQVVLIAASLLKLEEPTRIFWNFPPTCGFGGEGIGHKTASECIRALVML